MRPGLVVHLPLDGRALFGAAGDGVLNLLGELLEVLLVHLLHLRLGELGEFGADGRGLLFPGGAAGFVIAESLGGEKRGGVLDAGTGEEGLQAVVVAVEDGVELVIVAAGAAVGEAEEGGADGVGDVVEQFLPALHEVACVALVGEVAVEPGSDERGGVAGVEFVAGDLLADEAVVRLVLVEGVDDVVAVAPDVGAGLVALEALAVGVAGEVEPVARPALAVARRGEKAINDAVEGGGRVVGEERLHFFGSGQQSGEVERGAADERDLVGGRSGAQVPLFQLREHEGVDGIAHPRGVPRRRHGRLDHRLKGPPAALLRREVGARRAVDKGQRGGQQQGGGRRCAVHESLPMSANCGAIISREDARRCGARSRSAASEPNFARHRGRRVAAYRARCAARVTAICARRCAE